MNIENLQQISAQQTRVVIFNVHTTISKLITFVVNYLQKDIDIVTAGVENIEGKEKGKRREGEVDGKRERGRRRKKEERRRERERMSL